MGIRLTGFSTPVGGVSWEYTKNDQPENTPSFIPQEKIKVFISSRCGTEKYDRVRADLRKNIEDTQLAKVYTFEGEDAATLPAGAHYTLALEDADVCIFLIDNADGIGPGVQAEIDTVKKNKIKALYYFCDEVSTEKTPLEISLIGAQFAKSKTVHKFDDLSYDGARALISDIINVYHYYCVGRIGFQQDNPWDNIQSVDIAGSEKILPPSFPKTVVKNTDRCRDYILEYFLGYKAGKLFNEAEQTSNVDDWSVEFLPILLGGKSIKQFNTAMYLDTLKEQQSEDFHEIVKIRWQAIQAYFMDNLDACSSYLDQALVGAKNTKQPSWVIKDILIDQRNVHWTKCNEQSVYGKSAAQEELNDSSEELYYPIIDRLHNSLNEEFVRGLYKSRTKPPFEVAIGGNTEKLAQMIASSYVVSMYNGSLTHLLKFYDLLRDFLFFLSSQYDDWGIQKDLFKLAVFTQSEKEVKGIQDSFPEVLNKLSAKDALEIFKFCDNQPIKGKRLNSQLRAFGAVGYFLTDEDYAHYESVLFSAVESWISTTPHNIYIGTSFFKNFAEVSCRMSMDTVAKMCCLFMDKHFSRWYMDMFSFIERSIKLDKMGADNAKSLIAHIANVFDDEQERKLISYSINFLHSLRCQNRELTEILDQKTEKYFPDYYNGIYKLITTEKEDDDYPYFIKNFITQIKENNTKQGKDGVYYGHGYRYLSSICAMLINADVALDPETWDSLLRTVADTLFISKEGISEKIDAISLLICIANKYPEHLKHCKDVYEKILLRDSNIEIHDDFMFSSNINSLSVEIGLQLLYATLGIDVYAEIIKLIPCIQDDIPTIISVTGQIIRYLTTTDTVVLPPKIEPIILLYVLQWLHSENLDIRWNATHIMLLLLRNPENHGVINQEIIRLIDSDCAYIKNMIMRQSKNTAGISDTTRQFIISKCSSDENYTVRLTCEEVMS